jgi:putative membrane protein
LRILPYIVWFGGFGLLIALVGYRGFPEVAGALRFAGWSLTWVVLFHILPVAADALCWWYLFRPKERPSLGMLLWMRWVGEAVNDLLPVAQVGGAMVKARLLMQRGISGALAGSTVVVDLTLGVLSQVVYTLMGIGALVLMSYETRVVVAALIGVGISALMVLGFYLVQRKGMFGGMSRAMAHIGGDSDWVSLVGGGAILDQAIQKLYQRRSAIFIAGFWRLVGWVVGTGEVWLALRFLGSPVSLTAAFLLESLIRAVRSAAFFVPGALGIQEGGAMVLGTLVGVSPDVSLALALAKRVRELGCGLPGLLAWQMVEGRHLWRRKRADGSPSPEERD